MFQKKIGILGGMGAASSAVLLQYLIEQAQTTYHAKDDQDFPEVILITLPVAYLDASGESNVATKASALKSIGQALHRLEVAGANEVAICCNTAHVEYDDLKTTIEIPLVNLVGIVVEHAQNQACKKVGILASTASMRQRLYQNRCSERGMEIVCPTATEQVYISQVIVHAMAGTLNDLDTARMKRIITGMYEAGVDAVILGCTELTMLYPALRSVHPSLLDSVDLLATHLLQSARKETL